jgi:EAL domain-containing protein (putative c-di-GMP-specific phosphodiesterase class I)/GGDEF domain-containing protein
MKVDWLQGDVMKRYTWKLAIAFILSYILLMVVVVFAYTMISRDFINKKAIDLTIESGEVMAGRINAQFEFDYNRLVEVIESYQTQALDPIVALYNDQDELFVNGTQFTGFGLLDGRTLSIEGIDYVYIDDFEPIDYAENISVYSFFDAFDIVDNQTPYIFFNINNIILYFEAEPYFESILDISETYRDFFIMYSDNLIVYKSFTTSDVRFFYDYIDINRNSELIVNLKNELTTAQSGALQHDFLSLDSIISYNPLSNTFSEKQFYLVMLYDTETVFQSMSVLINILWALFFVVFLMFAGALVVLFKILETKINDIENARLTHYYAKPYIIRIRGNGKIIAYNQSFRKLLGDYDIYDYVKDFKIKKDFDIDAIEDVIHRQRAFTALFDLGANKTAYIRWVPIRTTGGYLLIGDDVTNIEGRFDEYRNMALFNPNTNLPNLNSLMQDLQQLFDDKELLSKKNVLLALDVVSFEKINLLLGERNGERFLAILAETLSLSLEGYPATLYNTKNDNFIILFKDIEAFTWIKRWTSKIITQFEKPITLEKNFINIDIKMGIFNIELERYEILNPEVCYENMMLALNHAKESTMQKEFVYDVSLSLIASREQRMEIDLANAIKNQEFYMVFQPQYNNQEERITGFEALIRWNNPKYASESPLKFIQMAEKNNMIIDIGRIALHETFMIAKEMEKYNTHISINVSPVQLLQAGFVSEVISIFEQYELKKHSISLEITETFLIGSFELVINKLKLLQAYGFDIHLDDFGTGYSSLQYLRDLPITTIKIDRAFIINLETDPHSRAIVAMISSLAKNVGLEVISEGIENDRQNQMVYKAGCNTIQGYFISRPVEKTEAIKLIQAYNIDKTKRVESVKSSSKSKETKK